MTSAAHRPVKRRLDLSIVDAGLAPTRERARALILAGRVRVDGQRSDKPGREIPVDAALELLPGRRPYASRGGEKLAPVLDALAISPRGLRCLDVGASTGGFTDVLLRAGAVHVTALDVGRGLIDVRLRNDPRVRVVEELNARYVTAEDLDAPYQLAVCDVSFISLALVLPSIAPLVPDGPLICLVKPQFEAGRKLVGPRGVVRDPQVRAATVRRVAEVLTGLHRPVFGVRASPLAGPKGNREIFLAAAPGPGLEADALEAAIDREVARGDP